MESKDLPFLRKRLRSFTNASRGITLFFKNTPNVWVHTCIFGVVLILSFLLNISKIEWLFILVSSGCVFVSEAFNTAIEIDIDLTSPEYHPYARDTKDVAAGAVLISVIFAVIVGLVIFIPKLI